MIVPILCLAALSLLGWVIVLKAGMAELKSQNRKLRTKLELGVREMTKDVQVIKGKRSWGKKVEKEQHPMHVE